MVLAVIASGDAYATPTWVMTDYSIFSSTTSASNYTYIDYTGDAYVGQKVSWYNTMRNDASTSLWLGYTGEDQLKGINRYTATVYRRDQALTPTSIWNVIGYTAGKVSSSSGNTLDVTHSVYDSQYDDESCFDYVYNTIYFNIN